MTDSSKKFLTLIWIALTVALILYFSIVLLQDEDKTVFMPGQLTDGHHQLAMACDSCHKNSYDDRDEIIKTCIDCHGDQREKPFDSHPRAKFTDPRNADRLQNIDALNCVTCHVEHQPDITDSTGVTQPGDFCIHCHSEIGKDRPSHKDMPFDSCASAGCHNYHNNRSLYTDFLIKHLDEPVNLEKQLLPEREFSQVIDEIMTYPRDQYPVEALTIDTIDKPDYITSTEQINHDWLSSSHARGGANCTACHVDNNSDDQQWINTPDHKHCAQCHDMEVKHFQKGKHGMRLQAGLPAMTPEQARLPMKQTAHDTELNCNSCHKAHRYDLVEAAVSTCLECHDDNHSKAYKSSKHYALWQKEISGDLPAGSGVSCASCHMPRISYDVNEWLSRIMVQHNQNYNLQPNSKMLRSVCLECHGLEFSIDALADKTLLENNFTGMPSIHVESMDLARQDLQRHQQKSGVDEQ